MKVASEFESPHHTELIIFSFLLMKNKINFKDNILISGASGMAGSAIVKSLRTAGYGNNNGSGKLLMPSHKELDLLDSERVNNWFQKNAPSVVIHAAGKVGGILANSSQPADFLLENLKMQTNIIDAAFKSNVKRFLFLGAAAFILNFQNNQLGKNHYYLALLNQLMNGMQ